MHASETNWNKWFNWISHWLFVSKLMKARGENVTEWEIFSHNYIHANTQVIFCIFITNPSHTVSAIFFHSHRKWWCRPMKQWTTTQNGDMTNEKLNYNTKWRYDQWNNELQYKMEIWPMKSWTTIQNGDMYTVVTKAITKWIFPSGTHWQQSRMPHCPWPQRHRSHFFAQSHAVYTHEFQHTALAFQIVHLNKFSYIKAGI